jgi:hypothetical protein
MNPEEKLQDRYFNLLARLLKKCPSLRRSTNLNESRVNEVAKIGETMTDIPALRAEEPFQWSQQHLLRLPVPLLHLQLSICHLVII